MNLHEIENVFGTLTPVTTNEKKGNWMPVIVLMVVVGVSVAIIINSKPKDVHYIS